MSVTFHTGSQEASRRSTTTTVVIIRSHRPRPLWTPHQIYTTQFSSLCKKGKSSTALYRIGLNTAFTDYQIRSGLVISVVYLVFLAVGSKPTAFQIEETCTFMNISGLKYHQSVI